MESLLADGHLGVFAAFLVYQFVAMQRRLDGLVASFQEQLDKIRSDYDERTEKMRERYDRVIDDYRSDADDKSKEFLITRSKVHNEIVSKLDRILEKT